MTETPKDTKADTAAGDAVLRKMLNTPPQPRKAEPKKKPKTKAAKKRG